MGRIFAAALVIVLLSIIYVGNSVRGSFIDGWHGDRMLSVDSARQKAVSPTPTPTPTPSPSPILSPGKADVIDRIDEYLNSFQGTCFGKEVTLGDISKFRHAIAQKLNDPLTSKTQPTGLAYMQANSILGNAVHDASKGTSPGRTSKVAALIAFDLDPASTTLQFKQKQTLMHEMTHHIEWLDGVKQPSKNNPPSERNSVYQDEVIDALRMWSNVERRLRNDGRTMNSAMIGWRELEAKLANLRKGLEPNGSDPGRGLPDTNLNLMTGFDVSFTAIQDGYIQKRDKNCGDRFKAMVYLAALLDPISRVDVEGPSDRVPPQTPVAGNAVTLTAEVVGEVDMKTTRVVMPPSIATSTRFVWSIDGDPPVSGPAITFIPKEVKKYRISVEFFVSFESTEYFITSGEYELDVGPSADPPLETPGAIKLDAPREVVATDTVDVKSIIPPNLLPKAKKADWYPQGCDEKTGTGSAKLSFQNPRDGKPRNEYISYVLRDANNEKIGEASSTILVKPVLFGGSTAGIWTASSGPGGVSVERQPAIRKFQDKDSGIVRAKVEVSWADSFAPKTLQEIEAEMIKAKGGNEGLALTPITIAGFKGYLLERKEIKQGATGSGYVDLGLPDTELGGWGYAIKNCIVIKFSFTAYGGGYIRGEWWAVWWNDVPFLRSQTRAAATEAKAVLTSLTLGPDGRFEKTPYKGPKLDGSDTPIVKLVLSPDKKKLRKGEVVNVQTVIENEENGEKPFKYDWSGEHAGTGAAVQFLANTPGKQRLGVVVPNVGGAAVEFEVEDLKAVIKQVTPASPKIMVGSPVTFSAQLLSGGQPVSGNFVYRWQPTPDVKFDAAEGSPSQVKAVFSRPGKQPVSVQILERKGEQLQILAQSESIEIDVTEDNRSALKLAQAKEIIPQGKLDEAIALAEEARGLDPKNTEAAKLGNKWRGDRTDIQNQLGKVRSLADQGKFPEAIRELDAAKKINPKYQPVIDAENYISQKKKDAESGSQAAAALIKTGQAQHDARNYSAAVATFDKAIAANPSDPEGYRLRGRSKRETGDLSGSLADLDTAVKLDPNNFQSVLGRGLTKQRMNDTVGAMADFTRGIQLNPTYAGGYAYRGYLKLGQKEYQGAKADYDQAIAIDSGNANYYINRGNTRSALKDHRGAISDYDRALSIDPRNAITLNNRGWSKEQLGDLTSALADYEASLAIDPNYGTAKANLASVKSKLGTKPPDTKLESAKFLPLDLTQIGGKKGVPHDLKGFQVDDGSYARLKSTDEKRLTYSIRVPSAFEASSVAVVSQLDDSIHMTDGMTIARMTVLKNTGEEWFEIKAGIHSSEWNKSDGPKHKATEPLFEFKLARPGVVAGIRFDYVESNAEKWWGHAPGFVLKGLTLVGQAGASTQTAPKTVDQAYLNKFTGRWNSEWGIVDFKVVGNTVTGTYPHDNGRIEAIISDDGRTMVGTWSESPSYKPPNDAGRVTFTLSPDGKTISGHYWYGQDRDGGAWTGTRLLPSATGTPAPTPRPTPIPATPKPTPTPASKVVELLSSMNSGGVNNSPTAPAQFDTNRTYMISSIMTYHWNNGRGTSRPGTISIRASNGTVYGPYAATGLPAGSVPDAFWEVKPNIALPPGNYVIVDSDPTTWAHNSQSGGRGFTTIRGYLVTDPGTIAPTAVTPPTVAAKAGYITAVFENSSNEAVHILGEEGIFAPENKLAPGERREVQLKMTPTGRMQFIAGRNGQVIAQKYWNGDPKNMRAYPRVVFDGRVLQITTGSR